MQARTSGTALARLVWLALGLTAGAGRLLFCSMLSGFLSDFAGFKLGKSTLTASGLGKLILAAVSLTTVVSFTLGSGALVACISFWLILTSLKGLISPCTTQYNKPLFLGSFRLNIIVLYLFMYLLSVLRNMSNISISMLATSFAASLSDISKSSHSHTLLNRMLVRERWILCLTWLLG